MKGGLRSDIFGPELRHQRELRGWSGAELAHAAGFHPATISNLERGLKGFSRTTVERLIAALGEDSAQPLLRAAGLYHSPDPLSEDVLRDLEQRLHTASPHYRRALRHVLRTLETIA